MYPRLLLVSLFPLVLVFLAAHGQSAAQQGLGRHFRAELPTQETFDVAQDARGFIWIGTARGLVCYDGTTFTPIEGIADAITEVEITPDGRVLIANSSNQLFYVDPDSIVPLEHNPALRESSIVVQDLWLDSLGSVILYNSPRWALIQTDSLIFGKPKRNDELQVLPQMGGRPLLVQPNKRYLPDRPIPIRWQDSLLPDLLDKETYFCNTGKSKEEVVIASPRQLFVLRSEGVVQRRDFPVDITGLFGFHQGHHLVGAGTEGLFFLDASDLSVNKQLFSGNWISSVFFDQHGGLWASSLNNGVFYLPAHHLMAERFFHGKNITDISVADDRALVSTFSDIYSASFPFEDWYQQLYLEAGNFESVVLLKDRFISLGRSTLQHQKGKAVPLLGEYSKSISVTDSLIYLTKRGLISVLNRSIPTDREQIHLPGVKMWDSRVVGHHLFVGASVGVIQLDRRTLQESDRYFQEVLVTQLEVVPLKNDTLIVAGTSGNGLHIRLGGHVHHFDRNNGLSGNYIQDLHWNQDSLIWIATNRGINVLDLNRTRSEPHFGPKINPSNALVEGDVNSVVEHKGRLLVGTSDGLQILPAHFSGILYNEAVVSLTGIFHDSQQQPLTDQVAFYPANNLLELTFRAPAYHQSGPVQYQYKLKGLSDSWFHNASGEVQFVGLPPGDYELVVRYQRETGEWSSAWSLAKITALPLFYQTAWFLVIAITGGLMLVVLVAAWLLRRQRRENELYSRINRFQFQALTSQMNPHFIFNSLNSINNFVLQNKRNESSLYLSSFARLVRSLLEDSRADLVPLDRIVENLEHYMGLEKLRLKEKLEFEVAVADHVPPLEIKLPPMLIQPFVENAIWHGVAPSQESGKVNVSFTVHDEALAITIHDNGIGRAEARKKQLHLKKPQSAGLMITQKRFELMSSIYGKQISYTITDLSAPTGTQVDIHVPL